MDPKIQRLATRGALSAVWFEVNLGEVGDLRRCLGAAGSGVVQTAAAEANSKPRPWLQRDLRRDVAFTYWIFVHRSVVAVKRHTLARILIRFRFLVDKPQARRSTDRQALWLNGFPRLDKDLSTESSMLYLINSTKGTRNM